MNKFINIKKFIKFSFYVALAMVFLILVDFRELSFKTILPDKINQTQLNQEIETGMMRNTKEAEIQNDQFDGNE